MAEVKEQRVEKEAAAETDKGSSLQNETRPQLDPEPGTIQIGNAKDGTGGNPFHALVYARSQGIVDSSVSDETLSATAIKIRNADFKANPTLKSEGYSSKDLIRIPDNLLSRQQKAEREAYREFPESKDRQYRKLAAKEKLGTIEGSEQDKLDRKRYDCASKKPKLPEGDLSLAHRLAGRLPAICKDDLDGLSQTHPEKYNAIVGKAAIDILRKEPDAKTVQGRNVDEYDNKGNKVRIKDASGKEIDLDQETNQALSDRLKQALDKKSEDLKNYEQEFEKQFAQNHPELLKDKADFEAKREALQGQSAQFQKQVGELAREHKLTRKELKFLLSGDGLSQEESEALNKKLPKTAQEKLKEEYGAFNSELEKFKKDSQPVQEAIKKVMEKMSETGLFPPGKQADCCCRDARQKALAILSRIENGAVPDGAACTGGHLTTLGFLERLRLK